MSFNVEICSSSLPKRPGVLELYRPKLHSFTTKGINIHEEQVNHLDVVSTWRGMSVLHAQELVFWEQATRWALQAHIEELLLSLFMQETSEIDDLSALDTLYSLNSFVNRLGRQQLTTHLRDLTDLMLSYHDTYGEHFEWLFYETEPYAALANYLRTFEFFSQNDTGVCLMHIDLSSYITDTHEPSEDAFQPAKYLHIIANILSEHHTLDFVLGPRNALNPTFREPVLSRSIPLFPLDIDLSNTGWDGKNATVTVTKHFPEDVRLERVYRVHLSDGASIVVDHQSPTRAVRIPDPPPTVIKKSPLVRRKARRSRPDNRIPIEKASSPKYHTLRSPPTQLHGVKNPLRAVSTGSARVQGTGLSDFERYALDMHEGLFTSYRDVSVHKANVLPKAVIEDTRSENLQVNADILSSITYDSRPMLEVPSPRGLQDSPLQMKKTRMHGNPARKDAEAPGTGSKKFGFSSPRPKAAWNLFPDIKTPVSANAVGLTEQESPWTARRGHKSSQKGSDPDNVSRGICDITCFTAMTEMAQNVKAHSESMASPARKHDSIPSLRTAHMSDNAFNHETHFQLFMPNNDSPSRNGQAGLRPVHRKSYDDKSDSSILPVTREATTSSISAPVFAEIVHSSEVSREMNILDDSFLIQPSTISRTTSNHSTASHSDSSTDSLDYSVGMSIDIEARRPLVAQPVSAIPRSEPRGRYIANRDAQRSSEISNSKFSQTSSVLPPPSLQNGQALSEHQRGLLGILRGTVASSNDKTSEMSTAVSARTLEKWASLMDVVYSGRVSDQTSGRVDSASNNESLRDLADHITADNAKFHEQQSIDSVLSHKLTVAESSGSIDRPLPSLPSSTASGQISTSATSTDVLMEVETRDTAFPLPSQKDIASFYHNNMRRQNQQRKSGEQLEEEREFERIFLERRMSESEDFEGVLESMDSSSGAAEASTTKHSLESRTGDENNEKPKKERDTGHKGKQVAQQPMIAPVAYENTCKRKWRGVVPAKGPPVRTKPKSLEEAWRQERRRPHMDRGSESSVEGKRVVAHF